MIQNLKSAVATAFIGAMALAAQAMVVPQTNIVESFDFALVANYQGTNTTNSHGTVTWHTGSERITTPDVIQLLGAATTNAFSKGADLLQVKPVVDGTNEETLIVVRDRTSGKGTKITTTVSTNRTTHVVTTNSVTNSVTIWTTNVVDVTGFFNSSELSGVTNATVTTNGIKSASITEVRSFSLSSDPSFAPLTTTLNLAGVGQATYVKIAGVETWDSGTWVVLGLGTGTIGTGTNAVQENLVVGDTLSTFTITSPVVRGLGYLPGVYSTP